MSSESQREGKKEYIPMKHKASIKWQFVTQSEAELQGYEANLIYILIKVH